MILTDKEIRVFVNNGNLMRGKSLDNLPVETQSFIMGAQEDSVTNIGYDLTAKSFWDSDEEKNEITLAPGSSVMVSSEEIIHFDSVTCGRVNIKNSRARMGMFLTSPVYQPGHTTRIYFRLTNNSDRSVTLTAGEKYAMLVFEQLHSAPENPYAGTFTDEFQKYKGLAGYTNAYAPQMKELEKKQEDLRSLEFRIYGNVITLLTIFVAIFTLLNVNISLVQDAARPLSFLLFNLSILGGIGFLSALMDEILHRGEKRRHLMWLIPIVCFLVVIVLCLFR